MRKSRPPFVKQSGNVDQTSCLWISRSSSLSSILFFFFFLLNLEKGKVKPPPPPNGHARISVNAEIYGRSLKNCNAALSASTTASTCCWLITINQECVKKIKCFCSVFLEILTGDWFFIRPEVDKIYVQLNVFDSVLFEVFRNTD